MPGDPGVVRLERLDERLDLADVAAAVGVALPEVRPLGAVLLGDRGDRGLDQLQLVAVDERVARVVRLAEEEVRVELDRVHAQPELGDHVHEHGRLLLPRAREADARPEELVRPGDQLLGRHGLEVEVRKLGRARRLNAKQHLLQRVGAQPEAERLERDDLVGRDVPEVDLGPEVPHEPGLRGLRRRLPDEVVERDRVLDLVDEPGAQLAGRAVDARGAALAALGDHLPRARVELLADPLHPQVRRDVDVGVLRADLGEDDEVAREVGDELELLLARDLERAVRDLDVREAEVLEPALELVELRLRRRPPRRACRRRRPASRTSGRARSSSRGCS